MEKTEDLNGLSAELANVCAKAMGRFVRCVQAHVAFHVFFALLVFVELLVILGSISDLSVSFVLAVVLAAFFLTVFSYCILRLYFQAKKPEQFQNISDEFFQQSRAFIGGNEGQARHHLLLAQAAARFSEQLKQIQFSLYERHGSLAFLNPALESFCAFAHWEDIFLMQEQLLLFACQQHIEIIVAEPSNLEAHAALANAYVMLSSLYVDPRTISEGERWISPRRTDTAMKERFRITAQKAIEEFKILGDYAPDDPWVHAQLAYSYHDLHMPQEEIREYETILRLVPNDTETLFKLGVLYFQQGKNSQGLHIYEQLKRSDFPRAAELIRFYGS